ncbi:MAG: hypothetical protein LBT59_02925 [Clostridiales bacterium]|jgi:hypothetical protein|nr:hypothetical protein [Clostridiales bacterium]
MVAQELSAETMSSTQGQDPDADIDFGDVWAIDQFLTKSGLKSAFAISRAEDSDTLLTLLALMLRNEGTRPSEFYETSVAKLLYPDARVSIKESTAFLAEFGAPGMFEKFVASYLDWCQTAKSDEDFNSACGTIEIMGATFSSSMKRAYSESDETICGEDIIAFMATFFQMELAKQLQNCGSDKVRKETSTTVLSEFRKTKAKIIDGTLHRGEFTSKANDVIEAMGMKIPASFKLNGNRVEVGEYSFNCKLGVS